MVRLVLALLERPHYSTLPGQPPGRCLSTADMGQLAAVVHHPSWSNNDQP